MTLEEFGPLTQPDQEAPKNPGWLPPPTKLARVLWAMIKHRRPYQPAALGYPSMDRSGETGRREFSDSGDRREGGSPQNPPLPRPAARSGALTEKEIPWRQPKP